MIITYVRVNKFSRIMEKVIINGHKQTYYLYRILYCCFGYIFFMPCNEYMKMTSSLSCHSFLFEWNRLSVKFYFTLKTTCTNLLKHYFYFCCHYTTLQHIIILLSKFCRRFLHRSGEFISSKRLYCLKQMLEYILAKIHYLRLWYVDKIRNKFISKQ